MSTEIKVGDRVRIKDNYPYAERTENKIGLEFVVTEVVSDPDFFGSVFEQKFYVDGDPQGWGVWGSFIEKVEDARVAQGNLAHALLQAQAEAWAAADLIALTSDPNAIYAGKPDDWHLREPDVTL